MSVAIKRSVTVQADGRIEIRSPELQRGARAEVIVILPEATDASRRPLASYAGACKGSFKTAEEVEEYLRRERDSWE